MKQTLLYIIIIFILYSCEKPVELTIDFTANEVINAKLNPDSVFQVSLSWSQAITSDTVGFSAIDNYIVNILSETDTIALENSGHGQYLSSQKPLVGETYQLLVESNEGELFTAISSVPKKPIITIEQYNDDSDGSYYELTLFDRKETSDIYWLSVETIDRYIGTTSIQSIYTDLSIGEEFNRTESNWYDDMSYCYYFVIPFTDDLFNGDSINFKIKYSGIQRTNKTDRISVFSVDENLYLYLRSVYSQKEQVDIGDAPIFYTPVNVYSNIDNGLGIFGSYSSVIFEFDNQEDYDDD